MQANWYKRLTRVLAWGFIARSTAPIVLLLLTYSAHLTWALLDRSFFQNSHVFDQAIYPLAQTTILAIIAGAIGLIGLGALLHQQQREPIWYQHLSANYYGLSLIWGGYLTGSLSMAAGVVLMGGPLLGFILLERRVVIIAFIISASVLLAINVISTLGIIAYAPLLPPPSAQSDSLIWTHSQLLMAAPHLIIDVTVAALLIGQWRVREQRTRELSLTDSLTGIHNRRSILAKLSREVSRAQRRGQALAVAVFDLDHFKQINDLWGHPIGDLVLQQTTAAVGAEIRGNDALGRIGGEEFLLIMPNTSLAQAQHTAERCRQRLRALKIYSDNRKPVPVAASFGVCCADHHEQLDGLSLIGCADQALYHAKADGRNRVNISNYTANAHQDHQSVSWHWRELLSRRGWSELLRSILGWSPVAKTMMVTAITGFISLNVIVQTSALINTADGVSAERTFNVEVAAHMRMAAMGVLAICLVLLAAGRWVQPRWPSARVYQIISLQFFSMALLGLGYAIGILYMPTGIMLLCSPIVGFMLFERAIVLPVFFLALATVMSLAYLSALKVIPYAPVLTREISESQLNNPLVTVGIYLFLTLCMSIVFLLVDNVLGSWRQREADLLEASQIDALTQVMNRQSVMHELDEAISEAQRQEASLAVALLDLDHFKLINDRWGHPVGDAVLARAAGVIQNALRHGDVIGRLGGEEFLLLFRQVDAEQAIALAERCRESLQQCHVQNEQGEHVPVSASLGVAIYGAHGDQSDSLIKAADEALYRAKHAGRNQVCLASANESLTPLPLRPANT